MKRLKGNVGMIVFAMAAMLAAVASANAAPDRPATQAIADGGAPPTALAADPSPQIRHELWAAVKNPDLPASDPVFAKVPEAMRLLNATPPEPADADLLIALIQDRRVTNFHWVWRTVDKIGADSARLHDPLVRRIWADYQSRDVVGPLAAQLPRIVHRAGAITADEAAILASPDRRVHALGLIEMQAEGGADAVPMLVRIAGEHVDRWFALRAHPTRHIEYELGPVDAARVALCRIGPSARAHVAALRALATSVHSEFNPFASPSWGVAFARAGVPLADIPMPVRLYGWPAETLFGTHAGYEADIRKRLAAFRPEIQCRPGFF